MCLVKQTLTGWMTYSMERFVRGRGECDPTWGGGGCDPGVGANVTPVPLVFVILFCASFCLPSLFPWHHAGFALQPFDSNCPLRFVARICSFANALACHSANSKIRCACVYQWIKFCTVVARPTNWFTSFGSLKLWWTYGQFVLNH